MAKEICIICTDEFDFGQVHECEDDFGLFYICTECVNKLFVEANKLFDEAIEAKETNNDQP